MTLLVLLFKTNPLALVCLLIVRSPSNIQRLLAPREFPNHNRPIVRATLRHFFPE